MGIKVRDVYLKGSAVKAFKRNDFIGGHQAKLRAIARKHSRETGERVQICWAGICLYVADYARGQW